ncbi:MAG: hypothetical protein U5R48_11235 [Gammaproteobacteria bacterium]|nr:hypothetical protein [Gammaproteobacteria bacterium]
MPMITTYEVPRGPGWPGCALRATLKISGDSGFLDGPSNVGPLRCAGGRGLRRAPGDLHASYAPRGGRFQNFEVYANWTNVFDEDILVGEAGQPGLRRHVHRSAAHDGRPALDPSNDGAWRIEHDPGPAAAGRLPDRSRSRSAAPGGRDAGIYVRP